MCLIKKSVENTLISVFAPAQGDIAQDCTYNLRDNMLEFMKILAGTDCISKKMLIFASEISIKLKMMSVRKNNIRQ